jgi:hypothetical protein
VRREGEWIPFSFGGGMRFPTLRIEKSSPGFVEANRLGTTRLSAHAINKEFG